MALVGYARTSTVEQEAGFEVQLELLKDCERVYKEKVSSVAKREQLDLMLDWVRDGDVVIVTSLSRLARSVADFCDINRTLAKKQVSLRILDLGLDTATASGKLMMNVFAAVAQFEREHMLERQRLGIAKAKREGKYLGRKPTARAKSAQVRQLVAEGLKRREVAQRCGMGIASVYRILAEARL